MSRTVTVKILPCSSFLGCGPRIRVVLCIQPSVHRHCQCMSHTAILGVTFAGAIRNIIAPNRIINCLAICHARGHRHWHRLVELGVVCTLQLILGVIVICSTLEILHIFNDLRTVLIQGLILVLIC
jgi:hypothetical protein